MKYPYYEMSVPVFVLALTNLKAVLKKGEDFAKEKKISDETMLGLRLAPDMFPLVKQVQTACDNAKGAAARLAGQEPPAMEDNEKTFAELYARIDKTLTYLATLKPEQFEGASDAKIRLSYFLGKHFLGKDYLPFFSIPNFFFHLVTAYDILRANGVTIGKGDYIGNVAMHDD